MVWKEGFANDTKSPRVLYLNLRRKLEVNLTDYCNLTQSIQKQMMTIYTKANNESPEQASAHILKAYRDMYACMDDLAGSRPSCAKVIANRKALGHDVSMDKPMDFIPCSTYLALPEWTGSNQADIADALSKIPNNLEYRINHELEWYSTIMKKLTDAIEMGRNPPTSLPDSPNSPATTPSGKPWSASSPNEGFEDATCSPAAMQLQRAMMKKRRETQNEAKRRIMEKQIQDEEERNAKANAMNSSNAASCKIPSLESEISRVDKLLQKPSFNQLTSKCTSINTSMKKLQSQQEMLKNGNLYDWQKNMGGAGGPGGAGGSGKKYEIYKGGDRTSGVLFSLQQNR